MASQDNPSNSADQADALVCRSAALLLRAGQETGLAGSELAPPLDRLLTAVSLELETDRGSVPPAVRCAATRLAEHVVKRFSVAVRRDADSDQEPDRPLRPSPLHRGRPQGDGPVRPVHPARTYGMTRETTTFPNPTDRKTT